MSIHQVNDLGNHIQSNERGLFPIVISYGPGRPSDCICLHKSHHVTPRFSPKLLPFFSFAIAVEAALSFSLSPSTLYSFLVHSPSRLIPSTMSFPIQAAARSCRQLSGSVRPSSLRIATTYTARTPSYRRWESTEAAAAAPTNPKIAQIVDQISTLTLLETADLVSSLKVSAI